MVRQRHPPGAQSRDTHTLSPVDYATPSDRMYGSEMDIEAVTVVDLGQGSVTDGAVVPGGLDGGTLVRDGTLPSAALDTEPPPLPDTVVAESELAPNGDGTSSVSIVVTWQPPIDPDTLERGWPADYFGCYVYVTNDSDNDPVTPAPVWTRPIVVLVGKDINGAVITGVPGATDHWVQIRTVDVVGNYSPYYEVRPSGWPVTTVSDIEAPDVPQAVSGVGGYKGVGIRWTGGGEPDLMFYEVRYAPSVGTPPTGPNTDAWLTVRTRSSIIGLDGLLPGNYYAQVRAVDFSGNVAGRWPVTGLATTDVFTSLSHTFADGEKVRFEDFAGGVEVGVPGDLFVVNATATTFQVSLTLGGAVLGISTNLSGFVGMSPTAAVNYLSDPEAGWSLLVGPLEATLIGTSDAYFNEVLSNIMATGHLDASTIETGLLQVGTGDGNYTDGIEVLYNDLVIGKWNEKGLDIYSKTPSRRLLDYLHLDDSQLVVFKNGQEMSAINADGINASAINFGISPGGHNLVFNSSFELSKFVATSSSAVGTGGTAFTGGANWVVGAATNASVAATAITMAAL